MKIKICTGCKKELPISEFYSKAGKIGGMAECKKCNCAKGRKYYVLHKEENKDRYNARNKKYYKEHPDRQKNVHLKHSYGITIEQHKEMYLEQNGCCAICNSPVKYNKVCTDHNHETGDVRGLLCHHCNIWLAALEDIEFVNKAKKYLKKYK